MLALAACVDPVASARGDRTRAYAPNPSPIAAPADLDLSPDRQLCETDDECVVVRGLPGQSFEHLCCTTCENQLAALNTRYAQRLAAYKDELGCHHAVCSPLGDCELAHVRADCWAGKCRRVPAP